jgi:hypothetical protein
VDSSTKDPRHNTVQKKKIINKSWAPFEAMRPNLLYIVNFDAKIDPKRQKQKNKKV